MFGLEYFVANLTIIAWGLHMWCFHMLHDIGLPFRGSAADIALPFSSFSSDHLGHDQSVKIYIEQIMINNSIFVIPFSSKTIQKCRKGIIYRCMNNLGIWYKNWYLHWTINENKNIFIYVDWPLNLNSFWFNKFFVNL